MALKTKKESLEIARQRIQQIKSLIERNKKIRKSAKSIQMPFFVVELGGSELGELKLKVQSDHRKISLENPREMSFIGDLDLLNSIQPL